MPSLVEQPTPPEAASGNEHHRLAVALAVVIPLGLVTKFVLPDVLPAVAGRWCLLYGAAVLYEVFWVLVVRWLAPGWSAMRCGAVVFVITCALEFLQLVRVDWLDALRRTFIGAALLGNGFDWWDFPHYVLGSAAGMWLVRRLARHRHPRKAQS